MILSQNPEALKAFTYALSVVSFGFILYHVVSNSSLFKFRNDSSENNVRQIIIQRLTGVFIFGFLSLVFIIFSLEPDIRVYGAGPPGIKTLIWLLILSIIILPLNYFNSKNPQNLSQYPQIRNKEWSYNLLLLSTLSWIAYLLAYEFLFRGFLLFSSLPILGLWPSIILNAALYSLVHIPKGNKETLGAIPFGILISYLTIQTGTFWIAFFAHVVLALSNEWFSFSAHPDMHLKNKTQ